MRRGRSGGVGGELGCGMQRGSGGVPFLPQSPPQHPNLPPALLEVEVGWVIIKEPAAGGVWGDFECGAKMGNPKAAARKKRVAGSLKAVKEKRGSAADKTDVDARKEKAQRVGDEMK